MFLFRLILTEPITVIIIRMEFFMLNFNRDGMGIKLEMIFFFFFRLLLFNCLSWKIYCDDHSSLKSIYNRSTNMNYYILYILHKLEMSVITKRITPNLRLTGVSSVSIDELLDADKGRSSIIILHLQNEEYRSTSCNNQQQHLLYQKKKRRIR